MTKNNNLSKSNIEEYLWKKIYWFSNCEYKWKIDTLYIWIIFYYYNSVAHTVDWFWLYEDKECKKYYWKIDFDKIIWFEDYDKNNIYYYTFDKKCAELWLKFAVKSRKEEEKRYDINTAKKLLDKNNIDYQIFDE